MSGFVSLESRLPPLWQSSPSLSTAGGMPLPMAGQGERLEPAPLPTDLAISRILMNAESLIASVTGLKAHEVQVSVNLARYEF